MLPLDGSGGGVIAFTSDRDGEGDIFVTNADGSGLRRLTDDPAYDGWPTWSPDGTDIAFVSLRSGNPDIYVMDADGGNLRQLTDHPERDIWPEWSPDGTRIAFPSRRDGNFEIYVINVDGSNLRRLTNTSSHEDFPAWSPDGALIAFSRTEGDDGTYIMKADGSDERRLADFEALEPAWSPDAGRIAFASDHEGFRAIYVVDVDGANLRRLSETRAGENCPDWSPDGTRIVFTSWRDGDGEIILMNADGSEPRRLTDNPYEDEFPAWRPTSPEGGLPTPEWTGPDSVLFIGNSLTFYNNLPEMFAALTRSAGRDVEVDMAAIGGATLAYHAAAPSTVDRMAGRNWDYVILQEQGRIPAIEEERKAEMYPAVRQLERRISEIGAETVLFMTWGRRDGLPEDGLPEFATMQSQVGAGYSEIADELGVMVAPVGIAWQSALSQYEELDLWQADGGHPSRAGSYLAACVFYAVIYQQSPEGLMFLGGLPRETADPLQVVASHTVLEDPDQWNIP
jgi:Tol biopolymer transport system component